MLDRFRQLLGPYRPHCAAVTELLAHLPGPLLDEGIAVGNRRGELVSLSTRPLRSNLGGAGRRVVLKLAKLSVGSVLKEGDPFITLAPLRSPVEAEVHIVTRDIGFVRPGDSATLKLEAFSLSSMAP